MIFNCQLSVNVHLCCWCIEYMLVYRVCGCGSLIVKMLDYCLEDCEFKSQRLGPCARPLTPLTAQLYK